MDVVVKFLVGCSLTTAFGAKALIAKDLESTVNQALQNVMSLGGTQQDRFVSDGSRVAIERLGISVAPVSGWEVETKHPSLSMVMVEPAAEKVEYNKPIYRRNITIVNAFGSKPLSEQVIEQLHAELTETIGARSDISEFRILDTKRFDYKGKEDGVLVYTDFILNKEYHMMQAHTLLIGEKNRILASYTDLSERFNVGEEFNKAWQTLSTIEVTGQPKPFYMDFLPHAAFALIAFILLTLLSRLLSKKNRAWYEAEGNSIYDDDYNSAQEPVSSSHSGMWNLGLTKADTSRIETRQSSRKAPAVSNESFITGF